MMIGRVCEFYGWTVEHVLKMPAPRFYLMLETIDRLEGQKLANQCYVARSAQMTAPAFKMTVDYFNNMGIKEDRPSDVEVYIPPPPSETVSRSDEAKRVMAAFAKDTKISRKVERVKESPHPRWRN